MTATHEPRLGWTRMPDGTYRCDLAGHRYEIQRGNVFAWVLSRDGVGIGNGDTLADVKRMGVRAAQIDNGVDPIDLDEPRAVDLADLAGMVWPWVVVFVPACGKVPGRWYVLNTRTRAAFPAYDQAAAETDCRLRNVG